MARRTCHALCSERIFHSTVAAKRHVWASIALDSPGIGLESTRGAFIALRYSYAERKLPRRTLQAFIRRVICAAKLTLTTNITMCCTHQWLCSTN